MRKLSRGCLALAVAGAAFGASAALPAVKDEGLASVRRPKSEKATDLIRIPFEEYRLKNGLTVLLTVDHSTPTVSVLMVYHVGSKNEKPGRTGFAHLFEHVMFTGSGNVPYGVHDRLTSGVGGTNNGATNNDVTYYYETVPSNYLETALWLESDRMGFLLEALDLAKLNAQRDVVKNERRQRVDNQPYGRTNEILAEAIYPKGHPYSWPVIGGMADLSAASEEDVKKFFRLYYAPNNAVLVISGDFDRSRAKEWVKRYFGGIPRGNPIQRPRVEPPRIAAEKRLVYEDRIQVPQLNLAWPTVGMRSNDQYALDVLADVLTGSRTSRLTQSLVYEKQLAASASASHFTSEDVGEFRITLTPRPGHTLNELEKATDEVLDRLKREGPARAEVQKVTAGMELSFLRGLESTLGKAMSLGFNTALTGDPKRYREDYRKTQAVTAAQVRQAANTYLTAGRVVLSVVPIGKRNEASRPDASTPVGNSAPMGSEHEEGNRQ